MPFRILVRGGGDLASGVIIRLVRAGWQVLVTELPFPLAVRRLVAFAQAVYEDPFEIEGIQARRTNTLDEVQAVISSGAVPVMVDPQLTILEEFRPHVLVDARMQKRAPEIGLSAAPLVIGLGPGFTAGVDVHAVIETNRGPFLGRVIWEGSAQPDTGIPERMGAFQSERVLRAPANGPVENISAIGSMLKQGDLIAKVQNEPVTAPFDGVLRGLVYSGVMVHQGDKIGDIDPRGDPRLARLVSDKALSIGGGVLEAVLSWEPLRGFLYKG